MTKDLLCTGIPASQWGGLCRDWMLPCLSSMPPEKRQVPAQINSMEQSILLKMTGMGSIGLRIQCLKLALGELPVPSFPYGLCATILAGRRMLETMNSVCRGRLRRRLKTWH